MERISIFNYEGFYLDFLEGTLSEEDTSLLFAFLKLHPELVVELDDLPIIDKSLVKIDSSFLERLKQTDLASDKITVANAESFMIASFEGQLFESKETELLILLNANPSLATEFAQIQQLKLMADESIVYPDKGALIQRKKIVLWPFVAAAASVLIFFFAYQGFQSTEHSVENLTANSDPKMKKTESLETHKDSLVDDNSNKQKIQEDKINNGSIAFNDKSLNQKNDLNVVKPSTILNENSTQFVNKNALKKDLEIARINKKDVKLNQTKSPEFIEVSSEKNHEEIAQANHPKTMEYSTVGMNDMKNPIKPITNRLSKLIKTEIDLRTAQGNSSKRKGFYLKIGKFEIERKGN